MQCNTGITEEKLKTEYLSALPSYGKSGKYSPSIPLPRQLLADDETAIALHGTTTTVCTDIQKHAYTGLLRGLNESILNSGTDFETYPA